MMNRTYTAATLIAAASFAFTPAALAQNAGKDRDARQAQKQHEQQHDNAKHRDGKHMKHNVFVAVNKGFGMNVVDARGDVVGEIDDLVINTHNGRVEFAVLSSGGVAGIGGEKHAVPYDALGWTERRDRITLENVNIDRAPDFNADKLGDLDARTWRQQTADAFSIGDRDWIDGKDRKTMEMERVRMKDGDLKTVQGRVTDIERRRSDQNLVYVTVEVDPGEERTVLLGPDWFVMNQRATPQRDQAINIAAVESKKGDHWIARSATYPSGDRINLRNADGYGAWENGSPAEGRLPDRYVLASDLRGADLMARDKDAGDIDAVIFECVSGDVGFLVVEHGDILGVGGDTFVIPFEAATLDAKGAFHVDAEVNRLRNAPALDRDDQDRLAEDNYRQGVYKWFSIDGDRFSDDNWNRDHSDKDWSDKNRDKDADRADRAYEGLYRMDREMNLEGRIVSLGEKRPMDGMDRMRTARIETADGSTYTVHLAPRDFLDEHDLDLEEGDRVQITGCHARHGDQKFVMARTIRLNGETITLRDGNDRKPAWKNEQRASRK